MRTSIIVPYYNQKDFVQEAIESALAQTVPCEVIVINDGSTDGGRFILDEYEGRIKVIHQVNKGLSGARNTGIMNATGEFILPLDADDILLPTAVERAEKVMDETGADVVGLSFSMFGMQGGDVILTTRPSYEDFKTGNRLGYCSMIRRAALLECGGYSPRMTWGWEDYHLWFDLLRRGKTIFTIPEPLWRYRVRHGSMIQEANLHSAELMGQIKHDFQIN